MRSAHLEQNPPKKMSNHHHHQYANEIISQTIHMDGTETEDFYFKDGLRYVKPYYFDYKSHAKGRWVGMTALEMYTKEFSYYTEEYVRKAIETQRITINGQKISPDRIIKRNELLVHRLHRHELPVLNVPLKVIPSENKNIVVIDKPPSLPVHPCGRYRKNSLTYLLHKEYKRSSNKAYNDSEEEEDKNDIYPIHRLDRMTSGILIISKTKQYAQQMAKELASNRIQKVYIAIVSGKWSNFNIEMHNDNTKDYLADITECNIKIWAKDKRAGIWEANDELGNYTAKTCFLCVSFDPKSNTSLILCRPITGRTHQIRVHLQALGHPIANDPCYGLKSEERRAIRKRKLDESREQSASKRQKLEAEGLTNINVNFENVKVESGNTCVETNAILKDRIHKRYIERAACQMSFQEESLLSTQNNEHISPYEIKHETQQDINTKKNNYLTTFDPMCNECIEESIHPVEPHELFIYLHSWVYINPGHWNIKSEFPFWLKDLYPNITEEILNKNLEHLLKNTSHINIES
jgi:RluA family pseudouridine synthase